MKMRSFLFVPADSDKKLDRARDSGSDVLIVDLEDSVAAGRKALAREMAAGYLRRERASSGLNYVRINPLSDPASMLDLAAVVGEGLDGVVLPKADGIEDVIRLGSCLDALEARNGVPAGRTRIIVVATETAAAMLNLAGYQRSHPRLAGLTWGAEDLSAALGASSNRESDGSLSHAYLMARSMCLVAAAAASVAPIDTLYADFRDAGGLENECVASRRRGFAGRIAIHPSQVEIINRCYSPTAEEVALARVVVEAFEAQPDVGTVGIDGKMYDRPHLVQALRTLAGAQP
ncbi:HpcH/HpaI aldolase/citrate lyase family protein [Aromatoleum toluclasticum]|uniref:HpcH/HpaI aldolase/citrate lyase family protein n=1 Tax=Aromatoleum toluclasticum TaxID=92003 RepID=UPI00037F6B2E|nr:CoA ester lyase [Aromatoleum toluclasticum]